MIFIRNRQINTHTSALETNEIWILSNVNSDLACQAIRIKRYLRLNMNILLAQYQFQFKPVEARTTKFRFYSYQAHSRVDYMIRYLVFPIYSIVNHLSLNRVVRKSEIKLLSSQPVNKNWFWMVLIFGRFFNSLAGTLHNFFFPNAIVCRFIDNTFFVYLFGY